MLHKLDESVPETSVKILQKIHSYWPKAYQEEFEKRGYKSVIGNSDHPRTKHIIDNHLMNKAATDVRDSFYKEGKSFGLTNHHKKISYVPISKDYNEQFGIIGHEHGHLLHSLIRNIIEEPGTEKLRNIHDIFLQAVNKEKPFKIHKRYNHEVYPKEVFADLHKGLMGYIDKEKSKGINKNYSQHVLDFGKKYGKNSLAKRAFAMLLLQLHIHINGTK